MMTRVSTCGAARAAALLLAIWVAAPPASPAQSPVVDVGPGGAPRHEEAGAIVVLLTLQGRLPAAAGDTGLPLALVDRLTAEPAMARVDVNGQRGASPVVTVDFAFESMAEFREWYASAAAKDLLRDVAAALDDPRRHVRFSRRGLSNYFPDS